MAALSITSLLSFNAEEQKSIKKKAKTIINRVMLNHSRTIKVFCEAMSTSAWQTSSTNSRFTWTRSMPSKCTSEYAQGEIQVKPCGCTFDSRAAQPVSNRHRVLVEETEIKQYTVSASAPRNVSSYQEGKLLKGGTGNQEPGTGVWEWVYRRKKENKKVFWGPSNLLESETIF